MQWQSILLEKRNGVGLITLNRPQALNALNSELISEINQALDQLEKDREIGCIVLAGSEKAFAAGADIKEMADLAFPDIYLDDFFHLADRIAQRRKPLIAAVSGYALGGGCELALMCDFIYCADNAKFGLPEVTLGVIPGIGGTQRLTHAIGKAKAMEMCFTARQMGAVEAEQSGLVARVFSKEELL
ncbi:enoyl-CoA hydratase, partial [Vibrio alginolyticus]